MKNIIPILSASLLSAFFAIFIYKQFEDPNVVYVNGNQGSPMYTNFEWDDPFSGDMQRTFLSSSPTDFTSAAKRADRAKQELSKVQGDPNTF